MGAPIKDDGWRVVTRRNRVARSPNPNFGLAQIQDEMGEHVGVDDGGG